MARERLRLYFGFKVYPDPGLPQDMLVAVVISSSSLDGGEDLTETALDVELNPGDQIALALGATNGAAYSIGSPGEWLVELSTSDKPVRQLVPVHSLAESLTVLPVRLSIAQANEACGAIELDLPMPGTARAATTQSVAALGAIGGATHRRSNVLTIVKNFDGRQTRFDFYLDASDGQTQGKWQSEGLEKDYDSFVQGIYSGIEDRHLQFKEDFQALNHELRVYGGALFDQLIPSELQAWLWSNWRDLDHIYVRSDEPFIPWELVHLKKPDDSALPRETRFLGQRGLTRWLLDAGFQPKSNLHIQKKSARYVIPDYANSDDALPNAQAERQLISDLFDASPLPQAQAALYRALGDPDSYDLLHLCCHGTGDSSDIKQARIQLAGKCWDEDGKRMCTPEYLSAETVRQTVSVRTSRPLVVMNACQSGNVGYAMTGLAGFAPAFLQSGAGAFIGTHWNVEDNAALTFVETLYGQLVTGTTVSEAMNAARTDARKFHDASWLAYVAYADPNARLTVD